MSGTVHVIGAGLAGLAAAVRLAGAGRHVALHEAAGQAGGRCRSYHDPALGMVIDNGNHLLLSGNRAALAYLETIGSAAGLIGPPGAEFAFVDLASRERWTLRISAGRFPWWLLDRKRRVPGTRVLDYLRFARMLRPASGKTICEVVPCRGALYQRLGRPLWVAALNTAPEQASAQLASAVLRETLAAGGKACRPLIARDGLGPVLVDPALRYISQRGASISFGRRLRALSVADDVVRALAFEEGEVVLAATDAVILTVPPPVAAELIPGLTVPSEFGAIVNAHFRIEAPAGLAPIIGVVNGTIEWLFPFPDRLSVTISAADRLVEIPRATLAQTIWDEVCAVTGLSVGLPRWQIVRERRATFAATAAQDARRPAAQTSWRNCLLAGDWTQTGLPATIEGAVRSGNRAADLVLGR